MTALSDLLTQAANVAREEGQLWLVSRIGADLIRLDAYERAKALKCPITCGGDEPSAAHVAGASHAG